MPLIYRPMKRDADGLPKIGTQSKELGVRIPPDPHADVDLNEHGFVKLNRRGMSVAAHWQYLRPHLVPKRFASVFHAVTGLTAMGSNVLAVFRIGDGRFDEGSFNAELNLALKHGSDSLANVVPMEEITIDRFLEQLAATRLQWIEEELSE